MNAIDASGSSYLALGLEAKMLALFQDCAATQTENAKQDVDLKANQLEKLRAQLDEAMKEAAEARENAGFWGKIASFFGSDVAKLAQLCAAAAVVIGSGGTGAPLVLAGMACLAAAEAGRRAGLDPKLCTALSLAGAALCSFSGSGISTSATKASSLFTAAGAGAQAASSGASIAEGEYEAKAERREAEAGLTEAQQEQVRVLIEQAFDRLRRLQNDSEQAMTVTMQTIQNQNYGREAVLSNF
ncbi:MAG: hypothetical protein M3020_23540 [Myxococcota bacterium]|jgi:hypothetical protein|nr:hypothetical protein [Myxococcota bacterium]